MAVRFFRFNVLSRLSKTSSLYRRSFHCNKLCFSEMNSRSLNSDFKSRIRIIENEDDSFEVVKSIIKLGEPVAVDVEVSFDHAECPLLSIFRVVSISPGSGTATLAVI
jgi:hypothetical protein